MQGKVLANLRTCLDASGPNAAFEELHNAPAVAADAALKLLMGKPDFCLVRHSFADAECSGGILQNLESILIYCQHLKTDSKVVATVNHEQPLEFLSNA